MMTEKFGNVTCPECSHKQGMRIPNDVCIPFYKCNSCGSMIKAKESCCVFCEYGDTLCPVSIKRI